MNLQNKIRVVIAEDELVLRKGIVAKITEIDSDFAVVAEAEDGRAALEAVRVQKPQVVLTDVKMPNMDGIELIQQLRLCHPGVKIVILSGYSDFAYTQQAIRHGVFRYLLKPIEDESLRDVLADLKNEMVAAQYRQNRTVIYSANYHVRTETNCVYALFVLCLGNLCGDAADPFLSDLYAKQEQQLDWHEIIDSLRPPEADWYLADEEEKNQKLICFCLPSGSECDCETLARGLQKKLTQVLTGTVVSVCTSGQLFHEEDISMCAQRMRNILHQKIVPARGNCFLLECDEKASGEEMLGIVRLRVNDQLRTEIQAKNAGGICRELEMILAFMADKALTQQDVQKVLLYILHMLEFSEDVAQHQQQAEVLRTLSCIADPSRFCPDMLATLMECIIPGGVKNDTLGLTRQLVEYVDKHYLQLDNLEDVANVFQYNYAYLSRLFKKEMGIPMSRYILEKRIELSKRMIENNDALSVVQIADMSGFGDKRYFHRAFKSCTGRTPQEYKKSIIIKG